MSKEREETDFKFLLSKIKDNRADINNNEQILNMICDKINEIDRIKDLTDSEKRFWNYNYLNKARDEG